MTDERAEDDELQAYIAAYVEEEQEEDDALAAAAAAYERFGREYLDVPTRTSLPRRKVILAAAVVALAAGLVGLVGLRMQSGRALDPEVVDSAGGLAAYIADTGSDNSVASPIGAPHRSIPRAYVPEPAVIPPPEPTRWSKPPMAPRTHPTPAAADPEPSALAKELESLRALRAAARGGDYSRALSLADRHRKSFTNPTMSAERDLIELEALCSLGRPEELQRAKAAFAEAHPGHHLGTKATGVCERTTESAQDREAAKHEPL